MSEAVTTPPAEESWQEKYKRQYMQLKGLAFESMMLDKIMRQNKIARDLAQRTADGTLGQPQTGDGSNAEDDMGIRIGDEIHHHHQPAPIPPSAPAPSGTSTLGKVAMGAAMLATGGLSGVAASALLAPQPAAVAPAATDFTDTDTDTRYVLEVSSEPPPSKEAK